MEGCQGLRLSGIGFRVKLLGRAFCDFTLQAPVKQSNRVVPSPETLNLS